MQVSFKDLRDIYYTFLEDTIKDLKDHAPEGPPDRIAGYMDAVRHLETLYHYNPDNDHDTRKPEAPLPGP